MSESMRTITTVEELDALPERSLIWYWIEWDSVRIHALMLKLDGDWVSATDPDDDYRYTPALPAQALSWPVGRSGELQEGREQ